MQVLWIELYEIGSTPCVALRDLLEHKHVDEVPLGTQAERAVSQDLRQQNTTTKAADTAVPSGEITITRFGRTEASLCWTALPCGCRALQSRAVIANSSGL